MSVVVKIEGVAIDANKIAEKSISIKRTFEKGRSLALSLYYTASEGFPLEGQDIEVLEDTTLLFGGIIKAVKSFPITPDQSTDADIKVQITSDGYNSIPQRRTINAYYTDTDAGSIVSAMVSGFLSEEGVTAGTISTGATIDTYNGIYESIKEVLDNMADASGYSWNINDSKQLNFESQETPVTTAKTLESDDGDHFGFKPMRSLQRFRNKQYVEGGTDINGNIIRVVVEDTNSILARAAAESNSGVYGDVYRDRTIQTESDAIDVATELLYRYVKPAKATFSSYGLSTIFDEGDVIEVDYPKYSIASGSKYLVTSKQLKREKHRWVYMYTIEARDSTDYSGKTKGDAVDFFSRLAKGSLYTGVGGSNSGITYDIVGPADLPIALGTTTVSRVVTLTLPDTVDLMTTLTFGYTATADVTLTVSYVDDTVTEHTFTLDLLAGENTKSFVIPDFGHAPGVATIQMDFTASADSVLQFDNYLLSCRWERYTDSYTPAPEEFGIYQLLADIEVTSAAVNQVDFTGLSLDSDDEIFMNITWINPLADATKRFLQLFVNNVVTSSSYRRQELGANGTAVGAFGANQAVMSVCNAGSKSNVNVHINVTESDEFSAQAYTTYEVAGSLVELVGQYETATFTVSSITELRLRDFSGVNSIGIGSRFRLYKKGSA